MTDEQIKALDRLIDEKIDARLRELFADAIYKYDYNYQRDEKIDELKDVLRKEDV